MVGNSLKLVLVVYLAATVAGSALDRNKRQWDFPFDDLTNDLGPYGHCGKPTMAIPNGGIKILPVVDFDDVNDNSCFTGSTTFCEPKFYCNTGYDVNGNIHLECVQDPLTGEYKWEGDIPTCTKEFSRIYVYVIVFSVSLVLSLIAGIVRYSIRKSREGSARRCVSRTTVVIPSSTTITTRTGGSFLPGGPPPYARFDDSNIQVPKDEPTSNPQA
ncbi:uncharacterized protein LOC121415981 [Lytechinus variegatus]|uniref:uncharacterized protein LOC121415981 n=1 Tax=Lytechinus variegatus TaxID=7654 RepID=UPI001BB15897|nr:uncharacterized protein LOC121415981 [Lytechinus variegatus]